MLRVSICFIFLSAAYIMLQTSLARGSSCWRSEQMRQGSIKLVTVSSLVGLRSTWTNESEARTLGQPIRRD